MNKCSCPAILISAPASGQGKTTVTAALAAYHRSQGRRVRIFKTGPDFIDPMVLERASGNPVYQLDLWMCGETHCRELLYTAACEADLILIEGVMGLFDGKPSSADLAMLFDIPVLAVIDGSAMAQTFGAIAYGLANYRPGLAMIGVLANRVASQAHYQMLAESLPPELESFGWMARDIAITLPERHLGLMQADEIDDLDTRITRLVAALNNVNDQLTVPVLFTAPENALTPDSLTGVRIAVAHDNAFSFLYRANLDLLQKMGAELIFFSPLTDVTLPDVDSLYLPGGYPELHLRTLATNQSMQESIRAHHTDGKPIVAECGGMLYLLESLTDLNNQRAPMLGLLPGNATMQPRLAALALQSLELAEGTLRGHTFHYSRMETTLDPAARGQCPNGSQTAEMVYRSGRLIATYIHFYFPSNPQAAAQLFLP